jgi:predicted TIM-barrel fold metal-dependent hydrolase
VEAGKQRRYGIIDADVHNAIKSRADLLPYLPRVWHEQWLATGAGVSGSYYSPVGVMRRDAIPDDGGSAGSSPAFTLKDHLDRYHIDYAILTGSDVLGISLHPDLDYGNAVAQAYNDWVEDFWLKASPRYRGSILINASDPPAAVREIERVAAREGMLQVIMASASQMPYGQRFYHPIYEAAERHRLPIAIHPGTEGKGVGGAPVPAGYPSRYMEWHNALSVNYIAQINSLVCEGVFVRFPTLKFVAIEGGVAWLPHVMWRMDKNYKSLRASAPWLKGRPSEYIREHVRLTTQPIEEPDEPRNLVRLVEMVGAVDMLMFSSDYPHWDFDNPKTALRGFGADQRRRILWDNAAALYGLRVSSTAKAVA